MFGVNVIVIGFYQLVFGFAATVFFLHSALAARVRGFMTIRHACNSAHTIMYVHYNTAGKGNV